MFSTIKKNRIDDVCTSKVAKDFVQVNEERRNYFGLFSVWLLNEGENFIDIKYTVLHM